MRRSKRHFEWKDDEALKSEQPSCEQDESCAVHCTGSSVSSLIRPIDVVELLAVAKLKQW